MKRRRDGILADCSTLFLVSSDIEQTPYDPEFEAQLLMAEIKILEARIKMIEEELRIMSNVFNLTIALGGENNE